MSSCYRQEAVVSGSISLLEPAGSDQADVIYHQCERARVRSSQGAVNFHLEIVILISDMVVGALLWVLRFAPPPPPLPCHPSLG